MAPLWLELFQQLPFQLLHSPASSFLCPISQRAILLLFGWTCFNSCPSRIPRPAPSLSNLQEGHPPPLWLELFQQLPLQLLHSPASSFLYPISKRAILLLFGWTCFNSCPFSCCIPRPAPSLSNLPEGHPPPLRLDLFEQLPLQLLHSPASTFFVQSPRGPSSSSSAGPVSTAAPSVAA